MSGRLACAIRRVLGAMGVVLKKERRSCASMYTVKGCTSAVLLSLRDIGTPERKGHWVDFGILIVGTLASYILRRLQSHVACLHIQEIPAGKAMTALLTAVTSMTHWQLEILGS